MLVTSIFSFSHSVFNHIKENKEKEIIILNSFNLSSANSFNLDQSKILSFDKELSTNLFTSQNPSPKFCHSVKKDKGERERERERERGGGERQPGRNKQEHLKKVWYYVTTNRSLKVTILPGYLPSHRD